MYIQCTKSENILIEEEKKIKEKQDEIVAETNSLASLNIKISTVEKKIKKLCDEIRTLNDEKNKKIIRINILREHVSIKLTIIEEHLDECLTAKTTLQKFNFESLQACQIVAYGLSTLLNVVESIKKAWEKDFETWTINFVDFCCKPTGFAIRQ